MANKKLNPMERARLLFEKSGLSLDELGQRMGYSSGMARKSAWQFLNKTTDPRLSMIQKFADAMSLSVSDILK